MTSRKPRLSGILAGTALALLLGGPSAAAPLPSLKPARSPTADRAVILVQDEGNSEEEQPRKRRGREGKAEEQSKGEEGGERRKRRQQAEQQNGGGEQQARERQRREQAEEDGEAEQPQRRQRARQGDESLVPDNGQGNERQRRREEAREKEQAEKRERDQQKAEERERQQQAEREERDKRRQQQAEEKQRAQQQAEQEQRDKRRQQARDEQRKQEKAEQEQRGRRQAEGDQRKQEQAEQQQRERRQAEDEKRKQEKAEQEQRERQQAEGEQRKQEQAEQEQRERRQREAERQRQDQEAAPDEETARERPRPGDDGAEEANGDRSRPRRGENAELPPGEAPSGESRRRDRAEGGEGRRPRGEQVDNGPPPADDRAAQEEVRPERVESVDAERGTRRRDSRGDGEEPRERERPRGTDVLREIGNRLILRYNDQVVVESSDRPRLGRNARDVYTEDLPNERTRETVVRENGVRVVTIRNRYGDVIRRSRITPDGREYVLNYVDEEDTARVRDRRDPGDDLPPFRPNVPQEDYILDAERAPSAEDYYEFLEKPPVERVERLYSLDEVKRSSRVRQKTRRIDLDTITFDFGSASVPESQINKLEGVATAMERLLKENPAETFLIEGHTDAVGSDEANLALSDRRAESVAEALTNVFAIPPENLATQGYGEQYLKVQSAAPERENRRVAIRRITPLVAPVAANAQ